MLSLGQLFHVQSEWMLFDSFGNHRLSESLINLFCNPINYIDGICQNSIQHSAIFRRVTISLLVRTHVDNPPQNWTDWQCYICNILTKSDRHKESMPILREIFNQRKWLQPKCWIFPIENIVSKFYFAELKLQIFEHPLKKSQLKIFAAETEFLKWLVRRWCLLLCYSLLMQDLCIICLHWVIYFYKFFIIMTHLQSLFRNFTIQYLK